MLIIVFMRNLFYTKPPLIIDNEVNKKTSMTTYLIYPYKL